MAFISRVTKEPSLQAKLATSQIIIIDKTGPSIPLGTSPRAVCLIAEWLSGPFLPREVTSTADLINTYGDVSSLLSQSAAGLQDGSNVRYEGNGAVSLLGKSFKRLIIQRVDTDMIVDDTVSPSVKAYVKFSVLVNSADQDPLDSTKTGKDIVVPAGRRFADAVIGSATVIVALSQNVIIPKGTPIASSKVGIAFNLVKTTDGDLRLPLASEGLTANSGATAFMVKGTTLLIGGGSGFSSSPLDTALDTAIPGVLSTISATQTDIGAITSAGAATAIFAPGSTGGTLAAKIDSLYAAAINKTRPTGKPQSDINVVWSARRGVLPSSIRNPLSQNAIDSSGEGPGRVAVVSGPYIGSGAGDATDATDFKNLLMSLGAHSSDGMQTETPTVLVEDADRRLICAPYVKVFSSDLGKLVDVAPDGWMATTISQFPEFVNPGAQNDFIQAIQGLQDPFLNSPLSRQDYINFRSKGIACLRHDTDVGWQFQDGVTSADPVTLQARTPIKRRRVADKVEDGLASIAARYDKGPATTENVESFTGDCRAFLSQTQKDGAIVWWDVDEKGGNDPQVVGLGVFTLLIKARVTPSMDTIVFSASIGETVQ